MEGYTNFNLNKRGIQTVDSTVLNILTGGNSETCKLDNEKELASSRATTFTATISGVTDVFSLFPGKVLFLGFFEGMGTISIAVSNHEVIKYMNFDSILVTQFSKVNRGTRLGSIHSRKGLQLEYCTQWKGESKFPSRFNNRLFYKQRPLDILNGIYVPKMQVDIEYGLTLPNDKLQLSPVQEAEFGSGTAYWPNVEQP